MNKTSETALMLAIRDAMLATGKVQLFRNNTGRMKTGMRWISFGLGIGSPDLVGILRGSGRFIGVEVKLPKLGLEPNQVAWHKAARESGALVYVAHSVEEALAGLDEQKAVALSAAGEAVARVHGLVRAGRLTQEAADVLLDGIE